MPSKIALTSLLFLLFIPSFFGASAAPPGDEYKIAFIGRGEYDSEEFGFYDSFIFNSILEITREIESNHKIDIEVVPFNLKQQTHKADSVYNVIVKDPSFILTIDNSWERHINAARKTIQQFRIPVIAINSSGSSLDFGTNSIFIYNLEETMYKLSAYTKKVLKTDNPVFITEDDEIYHNYFIESFQAFGLEPSNQIIYQGQKATNFTDSVNLYKKIKSGFSSNSDQVILINSHFNWGNGILEYLNDTLRNSTFITWFFPTNEFKNSLKNGNKLVLLNKSNYVASEAVLSVYKNLIDEDERIGSYEGAFSTLEIVKNCLDLVDIHFREMMESNIHPTPDHMADFLSETSRNGRTTSREIYLFDEKGKLKNDNKQFTVYTEDGSYFSDEQLNNEFDVIPSLKIGINLISMNNIDLSTNSFQANFEYWLTGPKDLQNSIDLLKINNLLPANSSIEVVEERTTETKFLNRYKVSGQFDNNYENGNYPFDRQKLTLNFELLSTPDSFKIAIDEVTFLNKIDDIKINGWVNDDYYLTVDSNVKQDQLSSLKKFRKHNSVKINLVLERNTWTSILQIVLPLFFIGAISIGILYNRNLGFSDLGEVIVGLFLSVIAYSISLSQLTPSFDVVTKADMFFLLTFISVFCVFMYLILLNSKASQRVTKTVPPFRLTLSILYPIIFIIIYVM